MPSPGDVVMVDFPGATGTKRRPAVVVSSNVYHSERPDLILGILTTNLASAPASPDYALRDWSAAGLHAPSAFRSYFGMALPADNWPSLRPRLVGGQRCPRDAL
jgi:mRNA interferase MazF